MLQQRLPDLVLDNFSYSIATSGRGYLVHMNYTVRNNGTGSTLGRRWTDQLLAYSSLSHTRHILYTYYQRSTLSVGEEYSQLLTVSVPSNVFGNTYVQLYIDVSNQIVEQNNQNNFQQSAPFTLLPLFPDLVVQNFSLTHRQLIEGGHELQLTWIVRNDGEVVTEQGWHDSIYISAPMTFNRLKLDDYAAPSQVLEPQMIYQRTANVSIPILPDYSLTYFISLRVNSRNSINENNRVANNMASISIQLSAPPSPDLQVTQVSFDFFQRSRILLVRWTVRNVGNSMHRAVTWADQIFLFFGPELSHSDGILLGNRKQSLSLVVDQSYNEEASYFLSHSIAGEFYVYVETDISNTVLELNGENNNILRSERTLSISLPPPTTVQVEINGDIESTVSTGEQFTLLYTVTNVGQVAISTASWTDVVYLSDVQNADRSSLLDDGFPLAHNLRNMQLGIGEAYTVTLNLTIPHGLTGTRFLAVVVDINEVLNTRVLGSFQATLSVIEGPLPDLTVVFESRNVTLQSGQPATISYQVINVGESATLASWYEALYLSRDALLDPFDTRLKSSQRISPLGVNESYIQSIPVFIPYDLSTTFYYIICVVDPSNVLFEESISNNQMHLLVSILETVSTDISIARTHVTPTTVNYDDTINFQWDIRNNGSLQAVGYKCDSIYLSEDDTWDISDYEVGLPQCGTLSINPHNNNDRNDRTFSRSAMVPFIAQHDYYGIVRTRTNIRDPSLTNNIGVSETLLEINAPSITLGVPATLNLVPNSIQVYKVDNVPEDATLVCTLATEELSLYHELFLRYDDPPTGFDFDAYSQFPLSSSQRAIVRHSREGTYYVRVESSFSKALTLQYSAELLVKVAQFEILDVSPHSAAPQGNVTVHITGTEFDYYLSASLINSAGNVEFTSIRLYWFSSESVYATFDIQGVSYGNYSIQLTNIKTGTIANHNNSFSVVQGVPGHLSVNIISPRGLRRGTTAEINIYLQNIGNTDILAPLLFLKTSRSILLRLVDDKSTESSHQLHIIGIPESGPGGILAPGATSSLMFQMIATPQFVGNAPLQLETFDSSNQSHDYLTQKLSLRPQAIPTEVWDVIWNNFLSSVGSTRQSFQQRVSEIASELSLTGRKVYSVNEIVNYQLKVAYGLLSGNKNNNNNLHP